VVVTWETDGLFMEPAGRAHGGGRGTTYLVAAMCSANFRWASARAGLTDWGLGSFFLLCPSELVLDSMFSFIPFRHMF
jgi:hypothetical protein